MIHNGLYSCNMVLLNNHQLCAFHRSCSGEVLSSVAVKRAQGHTKTQILRLSSPTDKNMQEVLPH